MALLFPTQNALNGSFHSPYTWGRPKAAVEARRTPFQARSELYTAWSVSDDVKNKANALSAEATKEFEKASAKAKATTGKIELYSLQYYAACTFGGLLACVGRSAIIPLL